MSETSRAAESLWLQPGQVIIRENDVSRELFVLLSGELSVVSCGRPIARIMGHGEVVGELGALTGKPRTATVSARTAAEVLLVRNATTLALERIPSVLEKIDAAIVRRFHIVFNKAQMYKSITATLRRSLLQEAMRGGLETRRGSAGDGEVSLLRHQVRQRIDDRLALYPDLDDPKMIERIAQEYGVQDSYRDKLASRPWLDDSLITRLNAIESNWKLIEDQASPRILPRKAETVIEAHRLLTDFETMPGIRKEMDILRMEGIVPFKAKLECVKSVYFSRHLEDLEDERKRLALERKLKITMDGVKADSGNDVVMVIAAARELGVEDEYESQIRNLVAMSESGTHFVDISGALVS